LVIYKISEEGSESFLFYFCIAVGVLSGQGLGMGEHEREAMRWTKRFQV
jgi:hypothetical protein